MKKTIVIITLTLSLISSFAFADKNNNIDTSQRPMLISANPNAKDKEDEMNKQEFFKFNGKIKKIINEDNKESLLINYNGMDYIFHIDESVSIFNYKNEVKTSFKEGDFVEIYFYTNTPMTMSNPAQITPKVIILKNDDNISVKFDRFDNELLSSDGKLQLNVKDNEQDKYKNKLLVVFYDITTSSLPPQTSPNNIVIVNEVLNPNLINNFDYFYTNEKKINYNIYNTNGILFVPIREISENLGYILKWTSNKDYIILTNGTNTIKFKLDDNKIIVNDKEEFLNSKGFLENEKSYMPLEFVKLLSFDIQANNGTLIIK